MHFKGENTMKSIKANIYLLTENEGGMTRDGFSGMQPSFNINGELIMSNIVTLSNDDSLPRGVNQDVKIDVPYGEIYSDEFVVGRTFLLQTGAKIIGRGVILELL
jgi:translation elongation factor EF-Tu-like GTPase